MTGFQRRTFLLEFEDPSFNGLEVRMRSADLRTLMRMEDYARTNFARPEHRDEFDGFCEELADVMISWNLLDDQEQPVAITGPNLAKEEWPLLAAILNAWLRSLTLVPRPLLRPSSDGDRLAGLSIPMETLSENPSSSSTPSES
jgi:hypothetical protein